MIDKKKWTPGIYKVTKAKYLIEAMRTRVLTIPTLASIGRLRFASPGNPSVTVRSVPVDSLLVQI